MTLTAAQLQQRMAENQAKTHCKRGHPFDKENTYFTKTGGRQCRTCKRHAARQRRVER